MAGLPYNNPNLHNAWLDNHALILKSNSAKYYFYEKSRFLHTFLKFYYESRKIYVKLKNILLSVLLKKVNLNVWQTCHDLF